MGGTQRAGVGHWDSLAGTMPSWPGTCSGRDSGLGWAPCPAGSTGSFTDAACQPPAGSKQDTCFGSVTRDSQRIQSVSLCPRAKLEQSPGHVPRHTLPQGLGLAASSLTGMACRGEPCSPTAAPPHRVHARRRGHGRRDWCHRTVTSLTRSQSLQGSVEAEQVEFMSTPSWQFTDLELLRGQCGGTVCKATTCHASTTYGHWFKSWVSNCDPAL